MILITKWRLARSIVLWFQEFWMVEKGRQGFLEPISVRGSFFTFETEVITFFRGAIGSVPHFCPYISTESTITGKRQEQGRRCWYLYTTSRSVVYSVLSLRGCKVRCARYILHVETTWLHRSCKRSPTDRPDAVTKTNWYFLQKTCWLLRMNERSKAAIEWWTCKKPAEQTPSHISGQNSSHRSHKHSSITIL